jgi:hypothetical protein
MGATIASHTASAGARTGGPTTIVQEKDLLRGDLGQRVEERLRQLLEQARRVLQENRFEVLAIAHALETYKTITGEDIAAIVEGYPGPLVDGRVYHMQSFIEVAEQYHQRALAAHKEQSRIDVPLPVFEDRGAFVAGIVGDAARWSWQTRRTSTPKPPASPK